MKGILGDAHTLTWFLRHVCETFLISASQMTELGLAAKALPLRLLREWHLTLRTVISKPQGFSHESQTVSWTFPLASETHAQSYKNLRMTEVLDSRSNTGHWAPLLTSHKVLCVLPTLPSSWACKSPRGAATPWKERVCIPGSCFLTMRGWPQCSVSSHTEFRTGPPQEDLPKAC